MPETYNGVTVPLSTDNADGPVMAKAMVDTLTSSTALKAVLAALIPAGTIRASITTAVESGWALMGTTITGGQTSCPALWAIIPAGWKTGSDIVLPDWSNRVLTGSGAIAMLALGGANSRSLVTGNLPAHTHEAPLHFHNAQHSHLINGGQTSATTLTAGNHGHVGPLNMVFASGAGSGTEFDAFDGGISAGWLNQVPFPSDGVHSHNINLTVDVANFNTGNPSATTTSSVGSGTALDTTPASVGICWKIKAH